MKDTMRGARLKWFEHIKRKCMDAPVHRFIMLVMDDFKRSRGRLKKY